MANDSVCPVCGMEVDSQTAPKATHKGQTYYFCSQECADMFKASPEKYAKKAPANV
jgi:YHS domain-containing protein